MMRRITTSKRLLCLLLGTLLFLYSCSPAPARQDSQPEDPDASPLLNACYPGYTLPEVVAYATTIVYAEITEIQPAYQETYGGEGQPMMVTPIELSPIEPLKGKDTDFVYYRMGGDYHGTRYLLLGDETRLTEGQRIVAFLNAYERDISPDWVLLDYNHTIRYLPDPAGDYTTIPTEEFLFLIREALAFTEEHQDP